MEGNKNLHQPNSIVSIQIMMVVKSTIIITIVRGSTVPIKKQNSNDTIHCEILVGQIFHGFIKCELLDSWVPNIILSKYTIQDFDHLL